MLFQYSGLTQLSLGLSMGIRLRPWILAKVNIMQDEILECQGLPGFVLDLAPP